MTRLFLRFYLGVIAILIVAWLIQGYVFRQRTATQNIRVVEQALSGGARLARDRIARAAPDEVPEVLDAIRADFTSPVYIVELSEGEFNRRARRRLINGEVVLYGNAIAIALPGNAEALKFGPLPQFVGPSQAERTIGFGVVFVFAAVAIAFLLRPVVLQLRAVERTATAIAEGDLSARIDGAQGPRGLPLANAFNTMAERTETLLRSQRELLQAVSHELRTPLARIRFAIDLIETSKSDEDRQKRLKSVDTALQNLDDLVGELLTYVRLESHENRAQPEAIDLNELFAELVEMHAPLHPSVRYEIAKESESVRVTADRPSLSRAIGNLLSNAGRYARQRVTIRAIKGDDVVTIEVDDDGSGIDEADRSKIFTPFVRLEHAAGRGAGLGLALVERIATRHGGRVEALASPSGGARFALVLPMAAPGDAGPLRSPRTP